MAHGPQPAVLPALLAAMEVEDEDCDRSNSEYSQEAKGCDVHAESIYHPLVGPPGDMPVGRPICYACGSIPTDTDPYETRPPAGTVGR